MGVSLKADMSQQAFYETVQREQEWREEQERDRDAQFVRDIASKWPSVLLWPGNKKSGPCFPSGNGNGFAPSSEPDKEPTMAKIGEMLPSNYLKQSDFPEDYIVTIRAIERKNIAMDGKPPEYKWLATYAEFDKPMVLNSTNIQLLAKACDSDDTEDWIGKQVIVYVDENVSFGGELVGGLRIRKHKQAAPVAPKAAAGPRPTAAKSVHPAFDDVPDEL